MNQQDLDSKIGEAWKAHYAGHDQTAVDQFLALVEEAPDNIDAHWGLGLSYRDLGDKDKAIQTFQKVKSLVSQKLETESGQLGRYFMLNRMADQQLERMGSASSSQPK
jgi:lipopolysaccharide biosynthesis regulator YciM